MSPAINAVFSIANPSQVSNASQQLQQKQGAGRSFENILQASGAAAGDNAGGTQATASSQTQGAQIRTGRVEQLDRGTIRETIRELSRQPGVDASRVEAGRLRAGAGEEAGMVDRLSGLEQEIKRNDVAFKQMSVQKDLSSGELLLMQMNLYQMTQRVELVSKVADQLTGGIKAVLNTNV